MDFRTKLRVLGWSQAKLGRKIGVYPSTVSEWVSKGAAPQYAEAYLDLALEVRSAIRGLAGVVE